MKIEGERPVVIDVLPHYFRKLDPVSLHFLYSQLYIHLYITLYKLTFT